jgi:hypothetical protein
MRLTSSTTGGKPEAGSAKKRSAKKRLVVERSRAAVGSLGWRWGRIGGVDSLFVRRFGRSCCVSAGGQVATPLFRNA